jgi:hypothetical protein
MAAERSADERIYGPRLSRVNDADWNQLVDQLSDAAGQMTVLARCLSVGPELGQWKAGDDLAGMSAADALDQARGDLERLAEGGATASLELLHRLLDELPAPLE